MRPIAAPLKRKFCPRKPQQPDRRTRLPALEDKDHGGQKTARDHYKPPGVVREQVSAPPSDAATSNEAILKHRLSRN
jgi:hypothetical protein